MWLRHSATVTLNNKIIKLKHTCFDENDSENISQTSYFCLANNHLITIDLL